MVGEVVDARIECDIMPAESGGGGLHFVLTTDYESRAYDSYWTGCMHN